MDDQDGAQKMALERPANDARKAWVEYWKNLGQPWRTEPEIDVERKKYLEELHSIDIDVDKGIYPFDGIKLSRADVEWLLATHDNGLGPVVDWRVKSYPARWGLMLWYVDLRAVNLTKLPMGSIGLMNAHLEKADLHEAHLEKADLHEAHLEGANLSKAHLEWSGLYWTHLEGTNLAEAHLGGADFFESFFSDTTRLRDVVLTDQEVGEVSFPNVHWGDVNVTEVDWSSLSVLGDERKALRAVDDKRRKRYKKVNLTYYFQTATRSYRQLAVVLRNQGLNEEANRFAYRAQLIQRKVFWYQRKILRYLGSLSLALLTGYGYKPLRSFLAYLIVILAFATAYFIIGRTVGPVLSPLGSVVFSMTSFHGRGFFPGGITLDDPLTVLAALEAFVGLLIEVTFIATLTRRLFSG